MANTLDAIMYKILARALLKLRGDLVMPRIVNSDYDTEAKQKGDTINVPIPTTSTAKDVTPSVTAPTPESSTPETVPIALDQWKHADFTLTDKDLGQINKDEHFIPIKMESAIDALAEQVNSFLFSQYVGVYGFVGTPSTTPFASDVTAATNTRKQLALQKCPKTMRRMVLDADAEANALALSQFSDVEKTGEQGAKINGEIGRKYGMDFYSDIQVPTHVAGTLTGTITVSGAAAVGAKTVTLGTDAGEAVSLKKGDIISFAGNTQTYAVAADVVIGASTTGAVTFTPGLAQALTGGEAIAVKGDHVVNLAFHRDAFAFAMRQLKEGDLERQAGQNSVTLQDPKTGIVLRLELLRQYKQWVWDLDILYGGALVRPECAVRLAG